MFRLLKAILRLNIKVYMKYNAIKWTRFCSHKVLNYEINSEPNDSFQNNIRKTNIVKYLSHKNSDENTLT